MSPGITAFGTYNAYPRNKRASEATVNPPIKLCVLTEKPGRLPLGDDDTPSDMFPPGRPALFHGLLCRQLARLLAAENAGGVDAGQTVSIRSVALCLLAGAMSPTGDSSDGSLHGPECSIIPCE